MDLKTQMTRQLNRYESVIDGSIDGLTTDDGFPGGSDVIAISDVITEFKKEKAELKKIRDLINETIKNVEIIKSEYSILPMRVKPIEDALFNILGVKPH